MQNISNFFEGSTVKFVRDSQLTRTDRSMSASICFLHLHAVRCCTNTRVALYINPAWEETRCKTSLKQLAYITASRRTISRHQELPKVALIAKEDLDLLSTTTLQPRLDHWGRAAEVLHCSGNATPGSDVDTHVPQRHLNASQRTEDGYLENTKKQHPMVSLRKAH